MSLKVDSVVSPKTASVNSTPPEKNEGEYQDTSLFLDNISDEAKRNLLRNSTRKVADIMDKNVQKKDNIASPIAAVSGGIAATSFLTAVGIGIVKASLLAGPVGWGLAGLFLLGTAVAGFALKAKEDAYQDKKAVVNYKNKLDENDKRNAPVREGLTGKIAGKIFGPGEEGADPNLLPSEEMIQDATEKLPNKGKGKHYFVTIPTGAERANTDVEYSVVDLDLNKYIGKSFDKGRDMRNISAIDDQDGFKVTTRNMKMAYTPVIREFANLPKDKVELNLQDPSKRAAFKKLFDVSVADNGKPAILAYDQNNDGKLDEADLNRITKDLNGDNNIDDKDKGILEKLISARKNLKDECSSLCSTL